MKFLGTLGFLWRDCGAEMTNTISDSNAARFDIAGKVAIGAALGIGGMLALRGPFPFIVRD